MDFRMLNGNPKATMLQRFNHSVLLITPEYKKMEFSCLHSCLQFVEKQGWEVNVTHIHPAGA